MTHPDRATILDAYDAECAARRAHWIGGEPQQCDLRAMRQTVSRALGVPVIDVAESIAARAEMAVMTDTTTPAPKCTACHGWGYHVYDCWPGDCICGFGDEECDECEGTGRILPDDYHGYDWQGDTHD